MGPGRPHRVGAVQCECMAIADLAEFKKRWPETIKGVISGRFSVNDHEELLVGKSQGIKNVIAFS